MRVAQKQFHVFARGLLRLQMSPKSKEKQKEPKCQRRRELVSMSNFPL